MADERLAKKTLTVKMEYDNFIDLEIYADRMFMKRDQVINQALKEFFNIRKGTWKIN